MVPCGVQPEELDVQHVGHPGQGMPVAGIADGGESPTQVFNGQAVQHVAVFGNVNVIVEIDEVAQGNLPEGAGDDDRKNDADQEASGCLSTLFYRYSLCVRERLVHVRLLVADCTFANFIHYLTPHGPLSIKIGHVQKQVSTFQQALIAALVEQVI